MEVTVDSTFDQTLAYLLPNRAKYVIQSHCGSQELQHAPEFHTVCTNGYAGLLRSVRQLPTLSARAKKPQVTWQFAIACISPFDSSTTKPSTLSTNREVLSVDRDKYYQVLQIQPTARVSKGQKSKKGRQVPS